MRRYRTSIMVGTLLYVLALSTYQTAWAESGDGSDQTGRHRDVPKNSGEVSIRVLPLPGTEDYGDDEYYRSGTYPGREDDYYGFGSLPFTGPGRSVTFALQGGVTAILLGSLLVFLSTRADRSRRASRIAGR